MPFRRLSVIALLALPQAGARSDDILYDYSGDVLPSDPASGWLIFNPCEGSCTELIENGRFVLFWPVPGDRAEYGRFIAVAPEELPPHAVGGMAHPVQLRIHGVECRLRCDGYHHVRFHERLR